MIKIISIICFLLISSLTNTYAQTETITIENDTETKSSQHSNFDVNFQFISKSGHKKFISVSLHNKSENEIMLLKAAHSKKELKKEYGVKYGKDYSGKNDEKVTPGCQYLSTDIIYIEPNSNVQIMEIDLDSNKTSVEFELPVYYVRNKFHWCKKRIFLDQQDIKYNVEVNLYRHKYEKYKQRYQALKEEYDSTVFCTNKAHKSSLTELQYDFEERRNKLAEEVKETNINEVKGDWTDIFNALYYNITSLDVSKKAEDCGKHTPPRAAKTKRSATKSLKAIREELENISTDIYNMGDMDAAKSKYSQMVHKLYYEAATHKDWDTNKSEHSKIVTYYNKIKELLNE